MLKLLENFECWEKDLCDHLTQLNNIAGKFWFPVVSLSEYIFIKLIFSYVN